MNFFDTPLPGWSHSASVDSPFKWMRKRMITFVAHHKRHVLTVTLTVAGITLFLLREQLLLFSNDLLSNPMLTGIALAALFLLWPEVMGMWRRIHLSHIPLSVLESEHPYVPSTKQIVLAASCLLLNGMLTATTIVLEQSTETYSERRVWQIANDVVDQNTDVIEDGMLARDVIGQTTGPFSNLSRNFTQNGMFNGGLHRTGMHFSHDIVIDRERHRMFVSHQYLPRVLVYDLNNSNQLLDNVPDNILGQPNFTSTASGVSVNQFGTRAYGMVIDSNHDRLFVSDGRNNRVLVFDITNITNGEDAIYVIGQPDFTTSASTPITATRFNLPTGLSYDHTENRLFVGDFFNRRILVFSGASLTNGMAANYVLGQPTFTADANISPSTSRYISGAWGLTYDENDKRLFASILNQNRIAVYSFTGGLTNYMAASWVLGQPTFADSTARTTQAGLSTPVIPDYDPDRKLLFVPEGRNNRVLIYNLSSGIQNYMSGSYVLGQSSFTTSATGTTASTMQYANAAKYDRDNQLLYVADADNNRVIQYDVSTIADGEDAIGVLGQTNGTFDGTNYTESFTTGYPFDGNGAIGLRSPQGMALDTVYHRLYIAEPANNRVLVHTLNTNNTLADRIPDYVLGQQGFFGRLVSGLSASLMSSPEAVTVDPANNRLYVADTGNNRVLVFDTTTLASGMGASYVLGQISGSASSAATTQVGLRSPAGVIYDSSTSRLYIADTGNSRVIMHSTASLSTGKSADAVLGQTLYTTSTRRTNQAGLRLPNSVAINTGSQLLYVADTYNNRMLAFGVSGSITNGQSGSVVLGQTSFTSSGATTTSTGLRRPHDVRHDAYNNRLYIADTSNNRVVMYASGSVVTGGTGSYVFGQTSFTSSGANVSQRLMNGPLAVLPDPANHLLYVSDAMNHRILLYNFIPEEEAASTSTVTSSTDTGSSGGGSRRGYVPIVVPGERKTIPGSTQAGQVGTRTKVLKPPKKTTTKPVRLTPKERRMQILKAMLERRRGT